MVISKTFFLIDHTLQGLRSVYKFHQNIVRFLSSAPKKLAYIFTGSFVRSFVHSFVGWVARSFVRSLINWCDISDEWLFGDAMCRIVGFVIEVSLTVSMFSLCMVAVERYLSICRIGKKKRTVQWTHKVIYGMYLLTPPHFVDPQKIMNIFITLLTFRTEM